MAIIFLNARLSSNRLGCLIINTLQVLYYGILLRAEIMKVLTLRHLATFSYPTSVFYEFCLLGREKLLGSHKVFK